MSSCAELVCLRQTLRWAGGIACVLVAFAGDAAYAQTTKTSHWGASVSFTPQWKAHGELQDLLWVEGEDRIEGSEFTVGIVRGSTRGGEWGVSFVRKPVKDGLTITNFTSESDGQFSVEQTHRVVFQDVYLQGVEFHSFIPFATIKDRVQIGLNLAGGIARTRGEIEETFENVSRFTLPNGQVITNTDTSSGVFPADEIIYKYQPLGKVEAQAAFILAPSFKLKVGGGFNMPSAAAFRVGAVFLIGAK
jgi:hypothetical protein